jgi:DNA-binding MurR/RpiR family transcriptional regulator
MAPSRPDIEARLREMLPTLQGAASRAIQFMIAQRDEVPFRSMRELAKRAGVPPVTLVRIAQRLGFAGFEEFREVYVDALQNGEARNRGRAAELVSLAKRKDSLGFAAHFAEREFDLQRQVVADLSQHKLNAAVRAIADAERVAVMGRRPFYAAAYSLSYSLRKVKPGTHLLDSGGGAGLEADGLTKKDLFIGFSSYPYSRITLAVARNAQRHGASIIAITDSENAPLAELADHVFFTGVKSYAFPDSISGACLIGNILVALTVSAYGQDGLKRIQENELEIINSGEYIAAGKRRKHSGLAESRPHAASPRKSGTASRSTS